MLPIASALPGRLFPAGGIRVRWQKGVSGNPKGRPPGQRNKRTELRGLLEEKAPELVGKAIQLALSGDATALRLCLERVLPALRSTDIPAALPDLSGSLTDQGQAVLEALGSGDLEPEAASTIKGTLAAHARLVESDHLEKRVAPTSGH